MARSERAWQMDWAGPHGTAWGTANACLTTITAAWLAHLAHLYWPAPTFVVLLLTVGAVILGIVATLLRAAMSRKPTEPVTVIYKMVCWVGVGIWLIVVLRHGYWPWKWFLAYVGVLIVAALVAGVCAGLASDTPVAPVAAQPAAVVPAIAPSSDPAQVALDALAVEWEARITRFCDGDGYRVPAIEMWPRGNGYTVQAVAPADGGRDWTTITRHLDEFAADLDLVFGGAIKASMGRTRRVVLIEVTTVDILAEETEYPLDRPVHSIRDNLQIGHRDDGELIGPNLLQNCMNLSGEARSGKTNASHCLTAEIVTTDDCLQWDWELTGGGLWAPWMYDWLAGVYGTPPIDWCGFDGRELLFLTRAALRVGYVRKPGYRQLMIDADDDKLPVSPDVPGLILVGDEIAKVTGQMSEHEEAKANLTLITFELGAVAVRTVFLGLRGTDDIISSGIQSQCQVRGVMKVNTKAEANWTLGPGHDFGPEDTPYPGSGGLILGSGEPAARMKWFRMKPSKIRTVARLAASRRPVLDELSRLAANGRHPNGVPMDDLLPGELDCYETRWERFRVHAAISGQPARHSAPPAMQMATSVPADGGLTPEQAKANIDAAMAAVDRRIAELNEEGGEEGSEEGGDEGVDAEFERMMAAEGFGDDWVAADVEETPTQPTDHETMLDLIRAAGPAGMKPSDLLVALATAGVVISRSTLHDRLNEAKARGEVHQPSFGRWAIGGKR